MRIQLSLPDDLYAKYEDAAASLRKGNGEVKTTDLIERQLSRFAAIPPEERVLVVGRAHRERLETLLTGGFLQDADDLVRKTQALADLKIGSVRVDFTPGQLEELKHRAHRRGIKLEELLKDTVRDISVLIFRSA